MANKNETALRFMRTNVSKATVELKLALSHVVRFSCALTMILVISGCASSPPAKQKQLRFSEEIVGTNGEELEWNFHSLLEYKNNDNDFSEALITTDSNGKQTLDFCNLSQSKKSTADNDGQIAQRGHGLQFPGYLVGIEKTQRSMLGLEEGPTSICSDEVLATIFKQSFLKIPILNSENQKSLCFMKRRLDDGSRMFLSHVAAFRPVAGAPIERIGGSLIYDAYGRNDLLCKVQQARGSNQAVPYEGGIFQTGYEDGLQALKKSLEKDLGAIPYTHLFIYVMGWNTGEAEAIENFNNLFGYMLDAAKKETAFRPLFIGITWPSAWSFGTGLWDDIWRVISFWNKKNDADELGMTWANYLLNDVIAGIKREHQSLRVVLVGHSFGARVASRTLYSCNLLPNPESCRQTVDLIIGLQSAFGRSRFGSTFAPTWQETLLIHPMHHEGIPYTDFSDFSQFPAQQAYLWSRYDSATSKTAMMGGIDAIERTWGKQEIFEHLPDEDFSNNDAPPTAKLIDDVRKLDPSKRMKKILLMDGSGFVRHDTPYHGGGAHSDIYNRETGQLTWELVRKFAP